MGFWNRFTKSQDPLLTVLLERYRLNLLSIPRENASVGDLYVQEKNSQYVSTPGSITNFLEPPFEIPPVKSGETMAGVSGTTSKDASGKIGMDFLEGFLNALGPAGIGTKVRGSYESSSKAKITFTFENPIRDYVDPGLLGRKLVDHVLMKRHALIAEDRKYYFVTAVARSSGISITTEGDSKQVMDVNANVMNSANVQGGISIEKNQTGSITFSSQKDQQGNPQKNLAFGVELYELEYIQNNGGQGGKFQMNTQQKAVVARGGEPVPLFNDDVSISLKD
jgi:hypothetical protein